MLKKIFVIAFITALLLVGAFYALNSYIYNEKQADEGSNNYVADTAPNEFSDSRTGLRSVTFSCEGGDQVVVTYNAQLDAATLVLEGDMAYLLARATTASGIKYTDENERVVFSEHQGVASIEQNGEVSYDNCTPLE